MGMHDSNDYADNGWLGQLPFIATDYNFLADWADVPITALYMADCESMVFIMAVIQ